MNLEGELESLPFAMWQYGPIPLFRLQAGGGAARIKKMCFFPILLPPGNKNTLSGLNGLIKWKNFPNTDNTYEPISNNIPAEMIKEYNKANK